MVELFFEFGHHVRVVAHDKVGRELGKTAQHTDGKGPEGGRRGGAFPKDTANEQHRDGGRKIALHVLEIQIKVLTELLITSTQQMPTKTITAVATRPTNTSVLPEALGNHSR